MINIKRLFFLLSFLPYGCFILEEPFYPYAIIFRNSCSYDIEANIPRKSQHGYQEHFPSAYLNFDGIPVISLKPGAEIILVDIVSRIDYGISVDYWEKFLTEDEAFTIRSGSSSRTMNKHEIIGLLRNKDTHINRGATIWIINDPTLCP
jgi:hypothetical protein